MLIDAALKKQEKGWEAWVAVVADAINIGADITMIIGDLIKTGMTLLILWDLISLTTHLFALGFDIATATGQEVPWYFKTAIGIVNGAVGFIDTVKGFAETFGWGGMGGFLKKLLGDVRANIATRVADMVPGFTSFVGTTVTDKSLQGWEQHNEDVVAGYNYSQTVNDCEQFYSVATCS